MYTLKHLNILSKTDLHKDVLLKKQSAWISICCLPLCIMGGGTSEVVKWVR
ncbi:MAG: hypothetical protein KF882_00970 [Bacteroidia bacterium]|nr:hypothetical protein [Bacteroidia bacterium]MCO5252966.1 hypothetical protein [Bacteroidota bacterium]